MTVAAENFVREGGKRRMGVKGEDQRQRSDGGGTQTTQKWLLKELNL